MAGGRAMDTADVVNTMWHTHWTEDWEHVSEAIFVPTQAWKK